jgi:hypothetical protein
MRNASAKGLEMKAAFNNKLPNQTNDVIVNLRNPDSKPFAASTNFLASPQLARHPTPKRRIFTK